MQLNGLRRLGRSIADRFRSPAPAAETAVNGPESDDVPTVEEIANAAEQHEEAREEYNEGARGKRSARKILDRVPSGIYGPWSIQWVQSSRREWDREAIAAFYSHHGEDIPTRPASPQLKLTRVVVDPIAPQEKPAPVDVVSAETAPDLVDAIFGAAKPSGLAA